MTDALVLAAATMDMFRLWGVQDESAIAMLGGRDDTPAGVLDRVVLLLCIHEALKGMFIEPQRIRSWLRSPNAIFEELSPLELIADGDMASLQRLKNYLFAEAHA